jgi:hypothetical protein
MSGIRISEQPYTPEQHAVNLIEFHGSADAAVAALRSVKKRPSRVSKCTIEPEDLDHFRQVFAILDSMR